MPRFSLRTLIVVMTLGGPLLAALIVRPVTLVYLLLAAPTILAVVVTFLLTLVFLGLGVLQMVKQCRRWTSRQADVEGILARP